MEIRVLIKHSLGPGRGWHKTPWLSGPINRIKKMLRIWQECGGTFYHEPNIAPPLPHSLYSHMHAQESEATALKDDECKYLDCTCNMDY
jgi:hypothetical protein